MSEPGSTFWGADRPPRRNTHPNHVPEPDQLLSEGSEYPLSLERSATPGSNSDEYVHRSSCCCSPAVSNDDPEDGDFLLGGGGGQADSRALLAQLELLHQECQEKEGLIHGLEGKLAEWAELHGQLQEKDRLNRQYAEALQAAESTIAYLTACSLDGHAGLGPGSPDHPCAVPAGSDDGGALQRERAELNKTLQEKERLVARLVEFLNSTGRDMVALQASLSSPTAAAASRELCSSLVSALRQMIASLAPAHDPEGSVDGPRGSEQSAERLQREAGSSSEAAGVLPGLDHHTGSRHEDFFVRHIAGESANNVRSGDVEGTSGCSEGRLTHGDITRCLSNCLAAADAAVASLAAHCTDAQSVASGTSAQLSPDLQHHLQRLKVSLQELAELEDQGQVEEARKPPSRHGSGAVELHRNIHLLYRVFCDHAQRISTLQGSLREERTLPGDGLSSAGVPGDVKAQLEALQKALKDKKKTCRILEEKLASLKPVTVHNPPCDPALRSKDSYIYNIYNSLI